MHDKIQAFSYVHAYLYICHQALKCMQKYMNPYRLKSCFAEMNIIGGLKIFYK